jgi:hypothetical protein
MHQEDLVNELECLESKNHKNILKLICFEERKILNNNKEEIY